jgi:hypothetical protein
MYTNDDLKNLNDEEKKKKRGSLQMEIIMLESEIGKLATEKDVLDADLRKIRMDEEKLRITSDEKKKRLDLVTRETSEKEMEIKSMKKKLNLLT